MKKAKKYKPAVRVHAVDMKENPDFDPYELVLTPGAAVVMVKNTWMTFKSKASATAVARLMNKLMRQFDKRFPRVSQKNEDEWEKAQKEANEQIVRLAWELEPGEGC